LMEKAAQLEKDRTLSPPRADQTRRMKRT